VASLGFKARMGTELRENNLGVTRKHIVPFCPAHYNFTHCSYLHDLIRTFIRLKDRQYKTETETDRIKTRLKSVPCHVKNLLKHTTNITHFSINRMVNHKQ